MQYLATPEASTDQPGFIQDYARSWQAADKIVFSRSLDAPSTGTTRVEREFDTVTVLHYRIAS